MSKAAEDQRTGEQSVHTFISTASPGKRTASAISALPVQAARGRVRAGGIHGKPWYGKRSAILLIYFVNRERGLLHSVSSQPQFSPLKEKFITSNHPIIVEYNVRIHNVAFSYGTNSMRVQNNCNFTVWKVHDVFEMYLFNSLFYWFCFDGWIRAINTALLPLLCFFNKPFFIRTNISSASLFNFPPTHLAFCLSPAINIRLLFFNLQALYSFGSLQRTHRILQ